VANPFLALVVFVAGMALWNQTLAPNVPAAIPAVIWVVTLAGSLAVLQYHCLDCGRSGWLFHWPSHACWQVVARRRAGQVRTLRGPNPTTQAKLWMCALFCAATLALIVSRPLFSAAGIVALFALGVLLVAIPLGPR
jgi:hypothetical protein